MTTKITLKTALIAATLTTFLLPGLTEAGGPPDPAAPSCRGQAITAGLAIAREAGHNGLGTTVGGPGLETVQDLQRLITEFCSQN